MTTVLPDADTSQLRLGRNWVRLGDPVRWRAHRGLWRFDGVDKPATTATPAVVKITGPASSGTPRTRYVHADQLTRIRPTEVLRAMVAGR